MSKDFSNIDYKCLVGQVFFMDEEPYVVRELSVQKTHTLVRAHQQGDEAANRMFYLRDVIDRLLVDEEIELFSPNYLGAR